MVNASAKNTGLKDWWMQRISASLISLFALPLLALWLGGWLPKPDDWYVFLSSVLGKLLSVVGLAGFLLHTRIGLWVVITDYVPRRFQGVAVGGMVVYLLAVVLWALYLLWMIF